MTTLALVTTYNEAQTLPGLILSLQDQDLPVCVIDDCSTDGTAEIVRAVFLSHGSKKDDCLISTPARRGIAHCLFLGYQQALFSGFDHMLQIDAGGSHDPYQYTDFTARRDFAARRPDLVIGSRYLPYSQYLGNPTRRQMSRLAAALCSRKTGRRIRDWTSGYRLFSRAALQAIDPPRYSRMHGYQIEVLASILRAGLKVREVPITYQAGRSSFNSKTALEAFYVWRSLPRL